MRKIIKDNQNNKMIVIMIMLSLIMVTLSVSYAFFTYNKTGVYTHAIQGGSIKVVLTQVK